MKIAAIDIGSNAVRLQISSVLGGEKSPVFKKIEYVRFPLRLGLDVFNYGAISEVAAERFIKLMKAFKLLMELFEVENYFACATSAIRTSSNGAELVERIHNETGIEITIIDGEQEALFIDLALTDILPDGSCLHIDVGGGSTELNLYLNRKKVATESFELGSVRNMQRKDQSADWKAMELWVKKEVTQLGSNILAIGTGGNISKLYAMGGKSSGQKLGIKKLQELRGFIERHSLQERINTLQLNPDRADVIIPAADIYLNIMRWANCSYIQVPSIGLKDGLLKHVYMQKDKGQ